jgi:HK97 family phage prohead protease
MSPDIGPLFLGPGPRLSQRLPLITRSDFKREPRDGVALRSSYTAEVKAEGDPAERKIKIRITTASPDRMGDTIAAAGWDLSNYLRNPVVLYGHDYRSLPIGRDEGISVDETGLVGTPRFTTAEQNPFGAMVYELILGRFLNAASVGFNPKKWLYNEERGGFDFVECELLEYSIVPVPANAECLIEARDAGIDLAPLKSYAEEILTRENGSGLWLPKDKAERVLLLLEPKKIVVPFTLTDPEVEQLRGQLGQAYTIERAEPEPAEPEPTPVTDPAAESTQEDVAAEDADDKETDTEDVIELADEPTGHEEPLFELVEEPAAGEELVDVSVTELAALVGAAVTRSASERLAALTGSLD